MYKWHVKDDQKISLAQQGALLMTALFRETIPMEGDLANSQIQNDGSL